MVEEKRLERLAHGKNALFKRVYDLDFGHCRLSIAAPEGTPYNGPSSLENTRIATSYVGILEDFLDKNSVAADIEYFFICDLVSTGGTLKANGLEEVATLLESEAVIIQTQVPLSDSKQQLVDKILQRLDGVLQVRESKYIMLHAPRSALAEIRGLLPGTEAPTVVPLDGCDDRVAIHAVCHENVFWETLENLKAAGASSLLVLPVEMTHETGCSNGLPRGRTMQSGPACRPSSIACAAKATQRSTP